MTGWYWTYWTWYFLTLGAILAGYVWTAVMRVLGDRYWKEWRDRPPGDETAFLWIFLVPALNEERTIADSVGRLRRVVATHKRIVVINDGSEDSTGAVLDSIGGSDLEVLTRRVPDARQGKAAALNSAYRFVLDEILSDPALAGWDSSHVIVCVVDADGRLAADSPELAARHFEDRAIGGVQLSVRIYNTTSWLTWMQRLEFEVFGGLYQLGRSRLGTAFMGGNGQFNRLSALRGISGPRGPWTDCLTEDQEMGLRLLERGWRCEHEPFTHVSQQGLTKLRALYRQRTRWLQGNLQVFSEMGRLNAYDLVGVRRLDALITLILPILQVIVGVMLLVSLILWSAFGVPYVPLGTLIGVAFVVQLAVGPVALGVSVLGRGQDGHVLREVARWIVPYFAYTIIMWPVVFRGMVRQLRGNRSWTKTPREAGAAQIEG